MCQGPCLAEKDLVSLCAVQVLQAGGWSSVLHLVRFRQLCRKSSSRLLPHGPHVLPQHPLLVLSRPAFTWLSA